MNRGTWEKHCANCAAYTTTDRAGLGRCATWRKQVSWSLVCDRWTERG